jgi:hypothetical protein
LSFFDVSFSVLNTIIEISIARPPSIAQARRRLLLVAFAVFPDWFAAVVAGIATLPGEALLLASQRIVHMCTIFLKL